MYIYKYIKRIYDFTYIYLSIFIYRNQTEQQIILFEGEKIHDVGKNPLLCISRKTA